jgi:hypothetical protein
MRNKAGSEEHIVYEAHSGVTYDVSQAIANGAGVPGTRYYIHIPQADLVIQGQDGPQGTAFIAHPDGQDDRQLPRSWGDGVIKVGVTGDPRYPLNATNAPMVEFNQKDMSVRLSTPYVTQQSPAGPTSMRIDQTITPEGVSKLTFTTTGTQSNFNPSLAGLQMPYRLTTHTRIVDDHGQLSGKQMVIQESIMPSMSWIVGSMGADNHMEHQTPVQLQPRPDGWLAVPTQQPPRNNWSVMSGNSMQPISPSVVPSFSRMVQLILAGQVTVGTPGQGGSGLPAMPGPFVAAAGQQGSMPGATPSFYPNGFNPPGGAFPEPPKGW